MASSSHHASTHEEPLPFSRRERPNVQLDELLEEIDDLAPPCLRHMRAHGHRAPEPPLVFRGATHSWSDAPVDEDEVPVYRSLAHPAYDNEELQPVGFDAESDITWRSLSWAAELELASCGQEAPDAACSETLPPPQVPPAGFVFELPSDLFDHALSLLAPSPGACAAAIRLRADRS